MAVTEPGEESAFIFCIGASHKSAPVGLREALHLSAEKLSVALPKVRTQFQLSELAALSTCNRCEVYGVTRTPVTPAQMLEIYLAIQEAGHPQNTVKPAATDIRSSTYLLMEAEAIRHIFRVAASLDSLVVGETQITSQFKGAMAAAAEMQTTGPILGRLTQEALAAAKKIRTHTAIGRRSVSISSAAIDLAKRVFGDLSQHRFLMIGAGEMASVASRHIVTYNPKSLTVANRTMERAESLTREMGFGVAASLENLFQLLCECDVVICASGAPGYIITSDLMRRVQATRSQRQMFMIDIALPRDIDPACGEFEDVYLFDIDDLQQVVDKNIEERQAAAAEGETLISQGVQSFEKWLNTLTIKPALQQFRAYIDDIIARESGRSLEKDILQSLNDKQKTAITAMLSAISGRICGDAGQQMKNISEAGNGRAAAELLQKLFSDSLSAKLRQGPRGGES